MFSNLFKKFKKEKLAGGGKPMGKPIGEITHYYGHLGVGIFKFNRPVKVGETIRVAGATTDFEMKIDSMQYDHETIDTAPKGKQVGIKIPKRAREGDEVYPTA